MVRRAPQFASLAAAALVLFFAPRLLSVTGSSHGYGTPSIKGVASVLAPIFHLPKLHDSGSDTPAPAHHVPPVAGTPAGSASGSASATIPDATHAPGRPATHRAVHRSSGGTTAHGHTSAFIPVAARGCASCRVTQSSDGTIT